MLENLGRLDNAEMTMTMMMMNGISVISARITNDDDNDNNGTIRVGRSRERVRRQCSSDLVENVNR